MELPFHNLGIFLVYCVKSYSLPWAVGYSIMVLMAKQWTRRTKPMELRKTLVMYNLSVCVMSTTCCWLFLDALIQADSLYGSVYVANVSRALLLYWLMKMVELFDTVLMILRHKLRQVSGLHVYHHASMIFIAEFKYHTLSNISLALPCMINSFIHVLLYGYYGISSVRKVPTMWKVVLTLLEITQFLVSLVFIGYGMVYHSCCVYGLVFAASMLFMFSNFFLQTYIKKKPIVTKSHSP